jgi:6-pyruvoyltetrahydropterin/6-carboxytetrahydropterin synthase
MARSRARKRSPGARPPEMEIRYEFGFDAAHRFTGMPRGHRYRGTHGHSFRAVVALRGVPRPPAGFVADFERVEIACRAVRERLDHALLNDIPGLGDPSLENLCVWIWDRLARRLPALASVTVRRDSLGQSCVFYGSDTGSARRPSGR